MKGAFLFIMNGILLLSFAQQNTGFPCRDKSKYEPALTSVMQAINVRPVTQTCSRLITPQYSIQKINKNLELDRRLIIAGAVLIGTGGVIFGVGLASMVGTRTDENFLAFALLMTGAPLIGTGVPLLGVGLAQRHKWRQRKNELNIQTGILSNAHLGLVMNY